MRRRCKCDFMDEQFLENEARWKRYTIPLFVIITSFTLIEYPIEWKYFHYHVIMDLVVIITLWVVNRFIIVKFHVHFDDPQKRKGKMFIKYFASIIISVLVVAGYIKLYHTIFDEFLPERHVFLFLEHRYTYLVTIIFVYFINANYERLFMFIELSQKAIEAEKYKKDSMEARFNNLKNKINPHFLFNTFNALSETIEEDPPKASLLVQELADVYRYVLDNQESNWVMLSKEIDFARSYINLLKMRFEDNMIVDFNIDETMLNSYIAPLTMQILIENAIKHNIISSKQNLKLSLSTNGQFISVQNNSLSSIFWLFRSHPVLTTMSPRSIFFDILI